MSRNRAIRLAAFDVDGTLIRPDTCCEAIARPLGRLERMREFERLSTVAQITAARAEMAGWYAGRSHAELCKPLADTTLAPGLYAGFARLRRHGIATALVSITWDFAVAWFARFLNADYYVGTNLAASGTITHFWPEDKARWIRALASDLDIGLDQVAAVGDSAGDVPMLQTVGLPFFVGQALPPGLSAVTHVPAGDIDRIARGIIAAGDDRISAESGRMFPASTGS